MKISIFHFQEKNHLRKQQQQQQQQQHFALF